GQARCAGGGRAPCRRHRDHPSNERTGRERQDVRRHTGSGLPRLPEGSREGSRVRLRGFLLGAGPSLPRQPRVRCGLSERVHPRPRLQLRSVLRRLPALRGGGDAGRSLAFARGGRAAGTLGGQLATAWREMIERPRIAPVSCGRPWTVLALLLLIAPLAPEARAQEQARVARLGFLGFGTPAAAATRVEALRAGLRDLGYVEGKNLVIEFRWSRTVEQMREAAAELARMKVDVIFASSSTEVEPARRATSTIPIVFAVHADPVGVGHVSSLARPGGNTTGLAMLQTGLTEKRLELLKETVPQASRFGVLWDRTAPSY